MSAVTTARVPGSPSRLKGKEGRIRGNLMGKRVDFSARKDFGYQVGQLGGGLRQVSQDGMQVVLLLHVKIDVYLEANC